MPKPRRTTRQMMDHVWTACRDLNPRLGRGLAVPLATISRHPRPSRGLRAGLCKLTRNQDGATTLEWALLLAAIAIPSYYITQAALSTLIAHYQMVTTLNALPFP